MIYLVFSDNLFLFSSKTKSQLELFMWKAFISTNSGIFQTLARRLEDKGSPPCVLFKNLQWPGFIEINSPLTGVLQSSSSRAAGVRLCARNVRSDEGMALSYVEPIAFPPLLASDTPPEYDHLLYHRLESGAWVWASAYVSTPQIKRKNKNLLLWAKQKEKKKVFGAKIGRFLLLWTTGVEIHTMSVRLES